MRQGPLLPQGPMRIRNFPRSQDRKVSELGHEVGSGMVSFPLLGLLRALNETCENARHDHGPAIECILLPSRDFKLGRGEGGGQRDPACQGPRSWQTQSYKVPATHLWCRPVFWAQGLVLAEAESSQAQALPSDRQPGIMQSLRWGKP